MASETVRITPTAHRTLKDLADQTGEPMTVVLEKALEAYRRRKFLEDCNRAYAELKADPKAWAEELKERETWDAALADGLEDA
jgi:predicted transcriptional regulator